MRIPNISESHLEGDLRHATLTEGGERATERILRVNDAERWYDYEYEPAAGFDQLYVAALRALADRVQS